MSAERFTPSRIGTGMLMMSHHGHSVIWKTMKTAHGAVLGGRHFRTSRPGSTSGSC